MATTKEILAWLAANPNATADQIAAVMNENNVTMEDMYTALPGQYGFLQPVQQALEYYQPEAPEDKAPDQDPLNLVNDIALSAIDIIRQHPGAVTPFGQAYDRETNGAFGGFNAIANAIINAQDDNDGGDTGGTTTPPGTSGGGWNVDVPLVQRHSVKLKGGGLVSIKEDPVVHKYLKRSAKKFSKGGPSDERSDEDFFIPYETETAGSSILYGPEDKGGKYNFGDLTEMDIPSVDDLINDAGSVDYDPDVDLGSGWRKEPDGTLRLTMDGQEYMVTTDGKWLQYDAGKEDWVTGPEPSSGDSLLGALGKVGSGLAKAFGLTGADGSLDWGNVLGALTRVGLAKYGYDKGSDWAEEENKRREAYANNPDLLAARKGIMEHGANVMELGNMANQYVARNIR